MLYELTADSQNQNPPVGKILLQEDTVVITLPPFSKAIIKRDGKEVKLLETQDRTNSVTGKVKLGDEFILEQGFVRSVYRVTQFEEEKEEFQEEVPVTYEPEDEVISKPQSTFPFAPKGNLFIKQGDFTDATSEKRKTTLTVGVLVLVLLVISVVLGINQKNKKDFTEKSQAKLEEAIKAYDESKSILSLDKEKSRSLFLDAKTKVTELQESGYKDDKLNSLLAGINQDEATVLGEVKVELKEFLDLTLQTSGFNGTTMVSSGEDIFVWDKDNKNVIQVGIEKKSAKIKAGSSVMGDAKQIGAYEDRFFSLDDEGIYEIDGSRDKVTDKDWEDPLFYLYAGNIYLVDKSQNKIFRYSGSASGFSSKQDWLAPGIEADFSKVKDVTIDGSIWLLSSTGKVSRFTNGSPFAISMSGITNNLNDPTAIYTNEKLKNVYVLDGNNGRVVVLEKNGNFKLQYVNDDLKRAKDLVVSEEEGKVILLNGSKVNYFQIN